MLYKYATEKGKEGIPVSAWYTRGALTNLQIPKPQPRSVNVLFYHSNDV